MHDITPDSWSWYEVPKKPKDHIKACPVCRTIFRIPEGEKLVAYCEECDTDYYFEKDVITPVDCFNYPVEHKRTCNCHSCRPAEDEPDLPSGWI